MGLTFQLIPALICLLACTSNFTHGRKYNTLQETIKMLNVLTAKKAKDPRCMELTVSDVLAAPKNTTEKETLCRAATVLRQVYRHHKCLTKILSGLDRNLSSMANKTSCPVNEARKRTLKDFLERLKTIMQEKYSKGGSWMF